MMGKQSGQIQMVILDINSMIPKGYQKAIEECLLSATALNLKRLVKAVGITEFTSRLWYFVKTCRNKH